MIKGIYLNELSDDCSLPISIQQEIFGDAADGFDETKRNDSEMPALYLLLCEEDGTPVGSARMFFSMDGIFRFDRLCVYENKRNKDISFEDIKNLIDYEINRKQNYSIIIFYGGEPLLQKNMIKSTIDYINSKNCKTDFYFGITTNGTLLDDDFINYMKELLLKNLKL